MYEAGAIYHCYNQGNNRENIFNTESDYRIFLDKMQSEIAPHADFLAYCLMPNHFHWLIQLKPSAIKVSSAKLPNILLDPAKTHMQEISKRLARLLSSYAKSYNTRMNRKGSLFRSRTKFKSTWEENYISERDRREKYDFREYPTYLETCFNYIHRNPVEAGLVEEPNEWPFSSIHELQRRFEGPRMCNLKILEQHGLI